MKKFFIGNAAQCVNEVIRDYFVLTSINARDKKGGGQYLALTLTDRTGSFDARMWENFADVVQHCSSGCYVKVEGKIERYNDRFQLILTRMRSAADSEIEVGDFQPVSQYPLDELARELDGYVDEFTNPWLQQLVRAFLTDPELGPAFRSSPAAKMLHHAWIGGLLEHVVYLARLCRRVAPQYLDEVDPDLLVTAAILHDMGKVRELAWQRSFSYTTEGQLLGHITIGIGLLRDKAATIPGFPPRLLILLEHIILSHHGKYEFGSPKLPMTPEAVVFSALDDLEAKLQNMRAEFAKAVETGRPADAVTDYSRSMERALLNSRAYLAADPQMSATAPVPLSSETSEAVPPDLAEATNGFTEPELIAGEQPAASASIRDASTKLNLLAEEQPADAVEVFAGVPAVAVASVVEDKAERATAEEPEAPVEEFITLFGPR